MTERRKFKKKRSPGTKNNKKMFDFRKARNKRKAQRLARRRNRS